MLKHPYAAHLLAALAGGLASYAVLCAATEALAFPADVILAVLFFFATQAAFAIVWRLKTAPGARALPGIFLAMALTAAAIPCGVSGVRAAMSGLAWVGEEGLPLIVPFLAEVIGFVVGFAAPMIPASWLIWRALGQRA